MRKTVSGIILTLLIVSTLTLAFNIQPVKASGTVYIKADGSIDPPDAPISTVDNITYTLTGNITSDAYGIVVERSNITIDGNGYTLQGPGSGIGFYLSDINNVTITQTTVKGFGDGVYLRESSNNSIFENNIMNNENGILILYYSSINTNVYGNNIKNNTGTGISLSSSSYNNISDNYLTDNRYGISVITSDSNCVAGNNLINNTYGINLCYSSDNIFYRNNFIKGEGGQVYDPNIPKSINVWDDGYPSGGNYLSNYIGVDFYRGPYQNETGSDGIGDTPYIINEKNQDRYPLMNLWPSGPGLRDLKVTLEAPMRLTLGKSTLLKATVSNKGIIKEENVTLYLFIHNTIVYSTTIPLLEVDFSHKINYLWTPSVAGQVNVTAYATPVPGEIYVINNQETRFVTISSKPPVQNINTGLSYETIQEAIDASETVEGHTIKVEAGIYYENVVVNKTVFLVGENKETTIIDANETGTVIKIMANNVAIEGFTIQDSGSLNYGIHISGYNHSLIRNNNVKNNSFGIYLNSSLNNGISDNNITDIARDGRSLYGRAGIRLASSSNNSITGNDIINNGQIGIFLEYSSNYNTISGNDIINNGEHGIHLHVTSGNTISGNNITGNMWMGIDLSASSNNNVSLNTVAKNGNDGISLWYSSNNSISLNTVTSNWRSGVDLARNSSNNTICGNSIRNNEYGVYIYSAELSPNNRFYHNNFIDNTLQVYSYDSGYANFWDDGYPSGGNYWSDYTGVDEFSGPNQDQSGSDGIGDIPYVIDEDNRDRYPLMAPKHELVVSVTTPTFLRLGSSSSLAAIVTNKGSSEETSVELWLLINGTIANSTIVPILQPGDSYTLNYLWTPTVEGTYNVTAYAPPVLGEALAENNQQTIFVNVSAPELIVSITAPETPRFGTSSSLKATVSNQGLSNETNVELWLLINGTIMNSTTISVLRAGDSYTLSFLWTPTVEGTYNVTAYATPVPGETSLENNHMTKFVTVTVTAPPSVQVGVKAGDWIKIDYTITGWPAGTPYPLWLKVEFLSVEGTSATARVTMRMSDGTEQNATLPVDVVAGGEAFGLSGFVIPANLTVGDIIYMSGHGNVTIEGETTRTYAGTSRTVVYASVSQYGTQLTYYWDKQTGVLAESSGTSDGMTITAKATETNMWQPELFGLDPILLYGLIIVTIVVVAAVAFLALRRKKKPPEEVENPKS